MSAPSRSRLLFAVALPVTVTTALLGLPSTSASAVGSPTLVINEVYGGGGNSGATYTNDFIELKNIGTTTVDVSGYSVQYASATGTSYQTTGLSGQIPAGQTYLVQEASQAAVGSPLPTPDATGSIAMAAGAGKVALVSNQTALVCTIPGCDTAPGVVDYVGYGPTANDSESAPTTQALTSTTSASRNAAGTDTDNNAGDFTAGTPTPTGCGAACIIPPTTATIAAVQGAGHRSPYLGQSVSGVTGVITARDARGFYLQDPRGSAAPGYVDGASSGIYVFTSTAPAATLQPGVGVSVDARVSEFRPGSAGLSTTELTAPTVTVVDANAGVPAPTEIGPNGLHVPTTVIDDDAPPGGQINVETAGQYQPTEDGIDFWESLEGMSVDLPHARAVGPTNTSFGETPIVPQGSGPQSNRGGIVLLQDDPNPERIILDDSSGTAVPSANVGDSYTDAIGNVGYDFNDFHLVASTSPTLEPGGITREVTPPAANDELSVATFNVENLDPTDPPSKFDDLAHIIVSNLQSPDLVALEEVQDNNGATDNGVTAANQTLDELVAAIDGQGGPSYSYQQIDPVNDAEGGEPGGNIRVAFLIQDDTPLQFVEHDPGTSTEDTDVVSAPDGSPQLTHSPGRVDPGNAAWAATRVPLAGQFTFGGQPVFVVANHWSSKGGDQPLYGANQPPIQGSEPKRVTQAQTVNSFVHEILDVDANANVVVLGDLNDFEYSDSVTTLTENGSALLDLPATLPDAERYTYVFDGNSQVLDHILLSPGLVDQTYDYDVVHVNAEFNDQASDHDPQVVDLHLGLAAASLSASASPTPVVYGSDSTVSGALTGEDGQAIGGATVSLESRQGAGPFAATGATATTGANGAYSFTVSPSATTDYRVVFAGDRTYAAATSTTATVQVATRVSVTVGKTVLKKGESTQFAGVVAPNHAGQSVQIQALRSGSWVTVATVTLDADSFYSYVLETTKKSPKGTTSYRVTKPADSDHVVGMSGTVDITVR